MVIFTNKDDSILGASIPTINIKFYTFGRNTLLMTRTVQEMINYLQSMAPNHSSQLETVNTFTLIWGKSRYGTLLMCITEDRIHYLET